MYVHLAYTRSTLCVPIIYEIYILPSSYARTHARTIHTSYLKVRVGLELTESARLSVGSPAAEVIPCPPVGPDHRAVLYRVPVGLAVVPGAAAAAAVADQAHVGQGFAGQHVGVGALLVHVSVPGPDLALVNVAAGLKY